MCHTYHGEENIHDYTSFWYFSKFFITLGNKLMRQLVIQTKFILFISLGGFPLGVDNSEKLPYIHLKLVACTHPVSEALILKRYWRGLPEIEGEVLTNTKHGDSNLNNQAAPTLHYTEFPSFVI